MSSHVTVGGRPEARDPRPETRLGMISYLNTAPFRYGLQQLGGVECVEAVPAELLALVEGGEVEAAILPAFDVLSHPDFRSCGARASPRWARPGA